VSKFSEKDVLDLAESLYPFILKRYQNSSDWKHTAKIAIAQIAGNIDENARTASIKYGYDETIIENIPIEMAVMPKVNDYVYILYWDSLTNAHIVMQNHGRNRKVIE
jgi:hypothetical protein